MKVVVIKEGVMKSDETLMMGLGHSIVETPMMGLGHSIVETPMMGLGHSIVETSHDKKSA